MAAALGAALRWGRDALELLAVGVLIERTFWHSLRAALQPYGVVRRVEDMTTAGLPDLIYCFNGHAGWIELKALKAWPARPLTKVNIPSLTADQVLFLETWERHGGTAWLGLQVGRWWGFVGPGVARTVFRRQCTALDLRVKAVLAGEGEIDGPGLIKLFTSAPGWRRNIGT